MKLKISLIFSVILWSGSILADSPKIERDVSADRVEVDFSKRAHFDVEEDSMIDKSDVAFAIPTNMSNTNDGMSVEKSILSHWGRSLGKASYIRDNQIVRSLKRTAASFQKATDFEIKTPEPKVKAKPRPRSPVDLIKLPQKTNHAFKVKVQALKQEAKLIYRGFFESSVTYKQKSNEVVIQANKALTKNSRFGVSSQALPNGSNTYVNYGYSW